jgi:hypothetical protein
VGEGNVVRRGGGLQGVVTYSFVRVYREGGDSADCFLTTKLTFILLDNRILFPPRIHHLFVRQLHVRDVPCALFLREEGEVQVEEIVRVSDHIRRWNDGQPPTKNKKRRRNGQVALIGEKINWSASCSNRPPNL